MKTSKAELLGAMRLLMLGVDTSRVVIEGSDTVTFSDGRMLTMNMSTAVSVPIAVSGLVQDTLEGAVSVSEFVKILERLPVDEIDIVADKGQWIIKAGKSTTKLTNLSMNTKRFEGIDPGEDVWEAIPERFVDALACCKMASNKSIFAGVYMEAGVVMSSDGWQINIAEVNADLPPMLITDESAGDIMKLEGIKEYQLQGSWLHVRAENGVMISSRILEGTKWPAAKIRKIFDSHKGGASDVAAVFPQGLKQVIERATCFSAAIQGYDAVKLSLSKNGIVVSSTRASGSYEEEVEWETPLDDFPALDIYVSVAMFLSLLKHGAKFYVHGASKESTNVQGNAAMRVVIESDISRHMVATLEA